MDHLCFSLLITGFVFVAPAVMTAQQTFTSRTVRKLNRIENEARSAGLSVVKNPSD
jgi:hypothetical protein